MKKAQKKNWRIGFELTTTGLALSLSGSTTSNIDKRQTLSDVREREREREKVND